MPRLDGGRGSERPIQMNGPLAGFKILELSGDVATRYCGRLFAQLGALVTLSADRDDRAIGYAGAAGQAYGRWLDAGKVSASCDAYDLVIGGQDAEGVAAAERAAAAQPARPVLLAVTWFDPAGPYATWPGSDEAILALNGVAYSFGPAIGPPTLAQGHAPQIAGGLVAFNAGLAALLETPERRPKCVAVNVYEAAMCFSETAAMTARADGSTSSRLGVNRFVPTYPCSAYRSSDGWVGVTCLTPAQWASLCSLIERSDVAVDPRYATAYQRLMLADEVDAILAPALAARATDAWVAMGIANRIPIAPMPTPRDLPDVPHWAGRGAFAEIWPGGPRGPTLPYRATFDGARAPRWTPGPPIGPLSGLRVVDFSMGWAGPLCARTLGDLGADVVKIESEPHPDWWRGWEAGSVDPATREIKHNFLAVNRNKRGVTIDLTTHEGLDQALALIAGADVVVENFAAGVLEKLGLGPKVQREARPGIISVSMPAFGNDGPLSGIRAYGSTVEQASSLPFVNGCEDWPPCQQHVAFGDPIAGLYAASAVLAALAGRERLGGCDIDLAQVACLFQIGADAIVCQQMTAQALPRTGSARARLEHSEVVRAIDGWLAVAASSRERLQTVLANTHLGDWARVRTAADAAAELRAAGLSAAPVQRADRLSADPHLAAVGFWPEMDRAFVGRHIMAAAPFRFDGVRPALRRPAPTLGEHTAEVLAELQLSAPR